MEEISKKETLLKDSNVNYYTRKMTNNKTKGNHFMVIYFIVFKP